MTKDYEAQISQLQFEMDEIQQDVSREVSKQLKPLIAELAIREKIQ